MKKPAAKGWSREFYDPIPLPRGRQLVTLEDAGSYITKLPKAKQKLEEWQTAMQGVAVSGRTEWANDVCPYRDDASATPQR